MSKSALIENGVVVQVALGAPIHLYGPDGDLTEASPYIACPDAVQVGWLYDGAAFAAPPPNAPPTDAEAAAAVTLTRAEFFDRWRAAVALQPGEPRILEWTISQVEASALPEAAKALYAERVETAVSFPRIDPDLGDVMATLGAVFGLSAAQVDDLFLGRAVVIDRARCPITGAVVGLKTRIETLEAGS
ncbi:MAG: hypothetical protein AAGM38_13950 [Pseudomonadota bacterium]